MGKTYAVLGGGGSFGIHTSKYLLEHANPKKVIGIGRNLLRSEPFSLNIAKQSNYEYHARHLTYELDLLLDLFDQERPDIIINYAAQGEGAVSWKNSWRFFETNCVGLARLCEELMKRDYLERFIQIGTSEMYGSVTCPAKETDPIRPSSPYSASKVAFDMHLMSIYKYLNFPMNIIRPSNAYCPGQLLHRVIPKTMLYGRTNRKLPLHGGGKAEKSYLHVRDLARAILMIADNAPLGEIYNVGPESPTAIRVVVENCAQALNVPFEKVCEMSGDRLGQDARYWLDSTKINKDVGWEPQIDWEEGLGEMVKWVDKYLPQLKELSTDYVMRG